MSLTQITKLLGITIPYLSYMVKDKRRCRRELLELYSYLVNTAANI